MPQHLWTRGAGGRRTSSFSRERGRLEDSQLVQRQWDLEAHKLIPHSVFWRGRRQCALPCVAGTGGVQGTSRWACCMPRGPRESDAGPRSWLPFQRPAHASWFLCDWGRSKPVCLLNFIYLFILRICIPLFTAPPKGVTDKCLTHERA